MSKFEIGDRVEFTPTQPDAAYPGDLEQYRGQQGTVVGNDVQDFLTALFGEQLAVVDVDWDDAFMRRATDEISALDDPHERTSFNGNLTKIGEAN